MVRGRLDAAGRMPGRKVVIAIGECIARLTAYLAAVTLAVGVASLSPHAKAQRKSQSQPKPPGETAQELADVERRLAILENLAPFQVIGKDHKPIFEVRSDGTVNEARVFAPSGYAVARMGATQNGGYFEAEGRDRTTARMGSEGAWAGLRFQHVGLVPVPKSTAFKTGDITDLELGRMPGGNYGLKFPTQGGDLIAAIGESKAGSGLLVIGDSGGKKVASMFVGQGNKGMIAVFAPGTGSAVAVMGEAFGNTGGSLVIGTEASEPRVKIGTNDNRYGTVETLPPSTVYVPRSGISGSSILGCAGGDSCVH